MGRDVILKNQIALTPWALLLGRAMILEFKEGFFDKEELLFRYFSFVISIHTKSAA